jgi:hypothetical protein
MEHQHVGAGRRLHARAAQTTPPAADRRSGGAHLLALTTLASLAEQLTHAGARAQWNLPTAAAEEALLAGGDEPELCFASLHAASLAAAKEAADLPLDPVAPLLKEFDASFGAEMEAEKQAEHAHAHAYVHVGAAKEWTPLEEWTHTKYQDHVPWSIAQLVKFLRHLPEHLPACDGPSDVASRLSRATEAPPAARHASAWLSSSGGGAEKEDKPPNNEQLHALAVAMMKKLCQRRTSFSGVDGPCVPPETSPVVAFALLLRFLRRMPRGFALSEVRGALMPAATPSEVIAVSGAGPSKGTAEEAAGASAAGPFAGSVLHYLTVWVAQQPTTLRVRLGPLEVAAGGAVHVAMHVADERTQMAETLAAALCGERDQALAAALAARLLELARDYAAVRTHAVKQMTQSSWGKLRLPKADEKVLSQLSDEIDRNEAKSIARYRRRGKSRLPTSTASRFGASAATLNAALAPAAGGLFGATPATLPTANPFSIGGGLFGAAPAPAPARAGVPAAGGLFGAAPAAAPAAALPLAPLGAPARAACWVFGRAQPTSPSLFGGSPAPAASRFGTAQAAASSPFGPPPATASPFGAFPIAPSSTFSTAPSPFSGLFAASLSAGPSPVRFRFTLPPTSAEALIVHDLIQLEQAARTPASSRQAPATSLGGGHGGRGGLGAGSKPCYALAEASADNPDSGEAAGDVAGKARTAEAAGCEVEVTILYSPDGGSLSVARAEGAVLTLWRAWLLLQSLRASLVLSAHALAAEQALKPNGNPISRSLARRARATTHSSARESGNLASLVASYPTLRLLQRLITSAPPSMARRLIARLLAEPAAASPDQPYPSSPTSTTAANPASDLPHSRLSEAFYAALVTANMVAVLIPSLPAAAGTSSSEAGGVEFLLLPPNDAASSALASEKAAVTATALSASVGRCMYSELLQRTGWAPDEAVSLLFAQLGCPPHSGAASASAAAAPAPPLVPPTHTTCRQVRVSRSGNAQFNGTYVPDGTEDGVTRWRHREGPQTMNRNSDGFWYMCKNHSGCDYRVRSGSELPPAAGWEAVAADSDRDSDSDRHRSYSGPTGSLTPKVSYDGGTAGGGGGDDAIEPLDAAQRAALRALSLTLAARAGSAVPGGRVLQGGGWRARLREMGGGGWLEGAAGALRQQGGEKALLAFQGPICQLVARAQGVRAPLGSDTDNLPDKLSSALAEPLLLLGLQLGGFSPLEGNGSEAYAALCDAHTHWGKERHLSRATALLCALGDAAAREKATRSAGAWSLAQHEQLAQFVQYLANKQILLTAHQQVEGKILVAQARWWQPARSPHDLPVIHTGSLCDPHGISTPRCAGAPAADRRLQRRRQNGRPLRPPHRLRPGRATRQGELRSRSTPPHSETWHQSLHTFRRLRAPLRRNSCWSSTSQFLDWARPTSR